MREPRRIVVVGPAPAGPKSRGGMATVMRLMVDDPDKRFVIRAVPTYVDASAFERLATGASGMTLATFLVLIRRADLLHVHLSHGGSVVRKSMPILAAKARGIPVVIHGHSFNFSGWMDGLPSLQQRIVRWMLPADRWLVLGSSLAADYTATLKLDPGAVQVLHNPVEIPPVRVRRDGDPDGTGKIKVVALGRLGQRKGSYDLIDAISKLPTDLKSRTTVVMAGDGETEKARSAARIARVSDILTVLDWIAPHERDELLFGAQIFVLPSYDEGLPMALLEAMSYGLVPISTPVGGIPEVVTDRVDGILVPPGEPDRLASALAELIADPRLLRALSDAARKRAEDFEVAKWYAALGEVWVSLLQGQRPSL